MIHYAPFIVLAATLVPIGAGGVENAGGGKIANDRFTTFTSIGNVYLSSTLGNFSFLHLFEHGSLDSDGDSLRDAYETKISTNASKFDTDADGLSDGEEHSIGLDPIRSDSKIVEFFDLRSSVQLDDAKAIARQEAISGILTNPSSYDLFTSAEVNATAESALASGISQVKGNPAAHGLSRLEVMKELGVTPHTHNWYYQPEWGWLWTNENTFPYVYRSATQGESSGWLYFREGTASPLLYYDYASEKWVTLGGKE